MQDNTKAATPALNVGDAHIYRVEELRIPNTIAYFTQDRDLIEANRHWLAPHFLDANDCFDLVFQSFIFEMDSRVVLVDPCTGNGKPHPIHFFNNLDIPFIERMTATGYRPEDIDFVVCTHLHHDHCGWNTQLRAGKWVPTFPNARYILRREEYERWGTDRHKHPFKDYNEGVFERSVLPVYEAGLADLVVGAHRLTPGAIVEPAPGHTIGHQTLRITSAGKHAIFTGDCFHHPIQLVAPSLPFGDSEDMAQSIAIRTQLKQRAADLDALLIPAHLCAPYALKVRCENDDFKISAA
jgi:glyoxylase-like metal-dependent hydrolase (beta-lactamase superfamily II)